MKACSSFGFAFCTALLVAVVFCTTSGQELQSPQPAVLSAGTAKISELKGEVTLLGPKGETISGRPGTVLSAESTIETLKGSLLLELQDGSQVLVKPHSRVLLQAPDQDKGSYLELLIGKVVNKITKRLGSAPSFRMGTPTAVITVRGTRFEVEVGKNLRTYVVVYEGLVEVGGLTGRGSPVFLHPGFITNVDRDREPSRPREIGALRERKDSGREGEGFDRRGSEHEGQPGQRQGDKDSPPNHSGPDN
jgi:hypothetical protein